VEIQQQPLTGKLLGLELPGVMELGGQLQATEANNLQMARLEPGISHLSSHIDELCMLLAMP